MRAEISGIYYLLVIIFDFRSLNFGKLIFYVGKSYVER